LGRSAPNHDKGIARTIFFQTDPKQSQSVNFVSQKQWKMQNGRTHDEECSHIFIENILLCKIDSKNRTLTPGSPTPYVTINVSADPQDKINCAHFSVVTEEHKVVRKSLTYPSNPCLRRADGIWSLERTGIGRNFLL
jgi:hypothetical protein